MEKGKSIEVNLYFSNQMEDMVKISIDKIKRIFWMPTIGSVLAIKRLSIKGCTVEHYQIIDCRYRFHIYQFHRKRNNWILKNVEQEAINIDFKELSILREIVNVIDVYDHLENVWLLLYLLGLNNKICVDIVNYAFGIYFQKRSYNLKVIKL